MCAVFCRKLASATGLVLVFFSLGLFRSLALFLSVAIHLSVSNMLLDLCHCLTGSFQVIKAKETQLAHLCYVFWHSSPVTTQMCTCYGSFRVKYKRGMSHIVSNMLWDYAQVDETPKGSFAKPMISCSSTSDNFAKVCCAVSGFSVARKSSRRMSQCSCEDIRTSDEWTWCTV